MIKYLGIIGVIILAVIGGLYTYKLSKEDVKYCDSETIETTYSGDPICYQGPVRPGDDLEHFRKTGETIPRSKE